jgi:hypothetical protein
MFHTSSKKSSSANHTSLKFHHFSSAQQHLAQKPNASARPHSGIQMRNPSRHPPSLALSSIGRDPPPATPTAPSPLSCNAGVVTGSENEGLGRRRRRGAWERTPTSVDDMCAGTSPPRPQPSAPTADSRPSFVEAPFSRTPLASSATSLHHPEIAASPPATVPPRSGAAYPDSKHQHTGTHHHVAVCYPYGSPAGWIHIRGARVTVLLQTQIVGNFGTIKSADLGVANANQLQRLRRSWPRPGKPTVSCIAVSTWHRSTCFIIATFLYRSSV